MANTSVWREEQRHKEGSVAFVVVLLFQGGFFFFPLRRQISWDASENQCNASADGCCVHQAGKRAGICFQLTSRSFSPTPTLNGLSFCRSWEVLAQPEIYAADQSLFYRHSAYLWLKSQQNILWSCQYDRPPLINTCQMLKLGDETPSMTRLEFLFFYFFPTRLNEYKSPGKCII